MKLRLLLSVLLGAIAWTAPVFAEPNPPSNVASETAPSSATDKSGEGQLSREEGRPWAKAVPPERQKAARALFLEGNALVRESLFIQAVRKYEEALALWDHPGIHYNLALALLSLEQPIRIRRHLLKATSYGADSLGRDKFRRAKQYLDLIEKQLTELVVSCEQPGARVTLDGELLFTAPGEYRGFVLPGRHVVEATAKGFQTTERKLKLVPSDGRILRLKLYKPEDWIRYRRRWEQWGPITLTGAGAAVLAAGSVLFWHGEESISNYDAAVDRQCDPLTGCERDADLARLRRRGERLQIAGVAGLSLGGAALITGSVLLYMNRETSYRVDPSDLERDGITLTPTLGAGVWGVSGQGRF